MNIKKISLLLVVLLIVSSLVACSKPQETTGGQTPANTTPIDAVGEVDWPTKTVEVVVPANAGGDTDFNARTFAKYFEKVTGKTMIVTNMPGGGGSVATSHVKDSKIDGNVILFGHVGQLIVNEVAGLIDYSYEDFDVATIPAIDKGSVLIASKQSGIVDAQDLIEKAKAKPDSIIYGTEMGGHSHLQGLIVENLSDIDLKIVDTGAASEKIAGLLSGRIDLGVLSYGSVQDYLESGEMVSIGLYSGERVEFLGDVKTFKEQGVDIEMDKAYVMAFPKGTDTNIIKKLSEVAEEISKNADYAKDLEAGYKQPISFLNTIDATSYLKQLREELMLYKDLLRK